MRTSLMLIMLINGIVFGYVEVYMMSLQADAFAFQEAILRRTSLEDSDLTGMIDGGSMGLYYTATLHYEQPETLFDPVIIAILEACGEISSGTDWASRGLTIQCDLYDPSTIVFCRTDLCRELYRNIDIWSENELYSYLEQNIETSFPTTSSSLKH
jgi:hypothetical protein